MPVSRLSQLARCWHRTPRWFREGARYAALFLLLFVLSRASTPRGRGFLGLLNSRRLPMRRSD
jgi:hypothetical protein